MKVFQESVVRLSVTELIKMINVEVLGSGDLKLPNARNPFPPPDRGELLEAALYYSRVPARDGIRLPPFCYYFSLAKVRLLIQALMFHTLREQRAQLTEQLRDFMAYAAAGAPVSLPPPTGLYTLFISENCMRESVPYSRYLRYFDLPAKADWYIAYRRMDFNKLKAALRSLVKKINDGNIEHDEMLVRARMIAQFLHLVTGIRRASDRDVLTLWMYNNILCRPR
jgi:hypothetical protein